ncbi:hypothetical protein B296_00046605 [Ensete ventricosum]|uniref:Uncharacterized protein n=1 Tax=Ensete ventricosum TaxID=4639 RepID=A0A426Z3A7_ENSVE|nr:hypothetical protein B296_00046605 [Ensete ventricosum]
MAYPRGLPSRSSSSRVVVVSICLMQFAGSPGRVIIVPQGGEPSLGILVTPFSDYGGVLLLLPPISQFYFFNLLGSTVPRSFGLFSGLLVDQKHYSIPEEYALCALLHEERPYNSGSYELSISVDALEVGLRFPLHPIIEECLK